LAESEEASNIVDDIWAMSAVLKECVFRFCGGVAVNSDVVSNTFNLIREKLTLGRLPREVVVM
jgi:hypothetical protein